MYRLLLLCFISIPVFSSAQWNASPGNALKQNITSPYIPPVVTFCGEKVPIEHFDVRESLVREMNSLCYGHSLMIYTLQLSERYMGIIENILKQQGVPDDMKYLCVTESNLQNLISPSKAAGFWQFMSGTAKEFGMQINAEIDERYNLEKATKAACDYLTGAYKQFGNWTLSAAAYNVGISHISNRLKVQQEDSYYNLQLNTETARYVFRAIAYKIIMQNPETYGYHLPKNDFKPLQYTEVMVTGPVNWIDIAKKYNTSYKILKHFNPWIMDVKLSVAKTYKVKIPVKRDL
ncbi:MAG: lytic transglycosylase domain-containing protein [Prevotellaceae bacterium]|jgi:hypothetical protein|nr:lytic transglycosylase domain-containing protein [Prevotellaceae bacterium]